MEMETILGSLCWRNQDAELAQGTEREVIKLPRQESKWLRRRESKA